MKARGNTLAQLRPAGFMAFLTGSPRRMRQATAVLVVLMASSVMPGATVAYGPIEPAQLPAPTLVTPAVGAASSANPSFTWTPVPGALQYDFEVYGNPGLTGFPLCGGRTSFTQRQCFIELEPGTYYWLVRSVGIAGQPGPFSAVRTFVKTARLTTAPTILAPASGTAFEFPGDLGLLRWSSVPNAPRYLIQVSDDPAFSGPSPNLGYAGHPVAAATIPTGEQHLGVTQYWRVRAVSGEDSAAGPWSATRSFVTHWSESPELVSPADGADLSSFIFRWEPMAGAVVYEVSIAADDDPTFSDPIGYVRPGMAWAAWPATDGETIRWRVRAENPAGARSPWSEVRTATADASGPASPPAPALILPEVVIDGPASGLTNAVPALAPFDFRPVPGASSYQLQWGGGSDPFTEPSLNDWHVGVGPIIWDADAGQTYSWRIRAEGPDGSTGPWSSVRTFSTPPMGSVALTGPPDGATVSYATVQYTWAPNPAAPNYDVQFSATADFASIDHNEVYADGRLVPWDVLAPGTWYWRVSARRGAITNLSPVRVVHIVDDRPPVGRLELHGGAAWTNDDQIVLGAQAEDVIGGVAEVSLSPNGVDWTTSPYPIVSPTWSLVSPEHGGAVPGRRDVWAKWADGSGNWSSPTIASIWYAMPPPDDTTPPVVTAPTWSLRSGTNLSAGKITTRLAWAGSDVGSGIARYELSQRTDGGAWTTVSTSLTSPILDRALETGHTYQFRVRAVDGLDLASPWVAGGSFRLTGYSEASSAVRYSGSWSLVSSPSYWGTKAKAASRAGAKATFTFTGRSAAFISRSGPGRGKAEIWVGSTKVATIDLGSTTYTSQRVVWSRTWTTLIPRTVTVKVLGTPGRPRVDVDGFVMGN